MFFTDQLLTPPPRWLIYAFWACGGVGGAWFGWFIAQAYDRSWAKILSALYLLPLLAFFGAFLGNDAAKRLYIVAVFSFRDYPQEHAFYRVIGTTRGSKKSRGHVKGAEIQPFVNGPLAIVPITSVQYELFSMQQTYKNVPINDLRDEPEYRGLDLDFLYSDSACIQVTQQRARGGAIRIITGRLEFRFSEPPPAVIRPCHSLGIQRK